MVLPSWYVLCPLAHLFLATRVNPRNRHRCIYVYVYICICICIYIYTHIHIYILSPRCFLFSPLAHLFFLSRLAGRAKGSEQRWTGSLSRGAQDAGGGPRQARRSRICKLRGAGKPIQDIVLYLGFCARINTILCIHLLCLPPPVIAHAIAQYNVPPRPPFTAIYTIQYWWWQYLVKAKVQVPTCACVWRERKRERLITI